MYVYVIADWSNIMDNVSTYIYVHYSDFRKLESSRFLAQFLAALKDVALKFPLHTFLFYIFLLIHWASSQEKSPFELYETLLLHLTLGLDSRADALKLRYARGGKIFKVDIFIDLQVMFPKKK